MSDSGPHPRCTNCGKPAVFTVRRRHSFGVGPYEQACETCAPAEVECATFQPFIEAWMTKDPREDAA